MFLLRLMTRSQGRVHIAVPSRALGFTRTCGRPIQGLSLKHGTRY